MTLPSNDRPIPDHTITAKGDVWNCRCGSSGTSNRDKDAWQRAEEHQIREGKKVIAKLSPDRLAAALYAGADESHRYAAVGLLARHEHWIGHGYLRSYMRADWHYRRGFMVFIDWPAVLDGLDETARSARVVERDESVPDALRADVDRWLRRHADERADAQPNRPSLLVASSSEIAVLRVAASLASTGRICLGDDLSNLDNTDRGLVLTAIGHLLSHGGGVPFRATRTWDDYGDVTRAEPAWDPVRDWLGTKAGT